MRGHDVVIVASRLEYAEACPLTLLEAWCSQTPLVASDHPMFHGIVVDGETGLSFRAGSSSSLAAALRRLRGDGELYERLSRDAKSALSRLPHAVPWDELLTRFLDDRPEDRAWLRSNSLASGKYREWLASHRAAQRMG
jgi:glycosyltransferase involved in cell wall biosynthesis